MKFRRELHRQAATKGWVEFHAQPGSDVSESELERELMPIIFAADPALEAATGRLVPGCRAETIATRLLLAPPTEEGGAHQIKGLTCSEGLAAQVALLAQKWGFVVVGDA
jgi:hypothetical protein